MTLSHHLLLSLHIMGASTSSFPSYLPWSSGLSGTPDNLHRSWTQSDWKNTLKLDIKA
jgi:hypothetical protein